MMQIEMIRSLTTNFKAYSKQTETGVEFWLARDLQHLLGYEKWDNFKSVVSKAKTACEASEHRILDHFADAGKTIKMPKGAQKTERRLKSSRKRELEPTSSLEDKKSTQKNKKN